MDRARIESEGLEALHRLYEVACRDSGQCRFVARFLLGLYNGQRFPFDLTDLRGLDSALFEDCMTVLRMDARLTLREVHAYFQNGGRKFEQLAKNWNIQDMVKVRQNAKRAAQPEGEPAPLHDGGHFQAMLHTCGDAPGYRDVTLVVRLGEQHNTKVDLRLSPEDSAMVQHHIAHVHALAWRNGERGPLDKKPGELRPRWLDRPPAEMAGYP
jgi:hypothetical protein